jgi:integrase
MRRGETCGLRWSDLDLSKAEVRVDESVITDDGGAVVKSPKTRASIRTIALDADTLDILKRLRTAEQKLAKACSFTVPTDSSSPSIEGEPPPTRTR